MSDINWKENAVCYGDGRQWFANEGSESEKFELSNDDGMRKYSMYGILSYPKDFQLNEIREGDFIPASELETEQKYNEAVEVFGLFGFKFKENDNYSLIRKSEMLTARDSGALIYYMRSDDIVENCKRQLTYSQIIAIGKLKRMMLEREKSNHSDITQNEKRNKSKQAYDILKSLDYEYDLVKQRWYKKEYI